MSSPGTGGAPLGLAPRRRDRGRRRALISVVSMAGLAALGFCPHAQAKGKAAGDAPPALLSTGGASGWKSIRQLEAAAEKGDPKACYDLALLCLDGSAGVRKDADRAAALYERAARGGIADAWFRLGKMFHDGIGVDRDYTRAFRYFLAGARAGVPEAQHNVGAMLVSARGVRRDFVEGLAWLIVSVKSGAPANAVEEVRKRLAGRPAAIAAAEQRAKELLADPNSGSDADDGGLPSPPGPQPPPRVEPSKPEMTPPAIQVVPPRMTIPTEPISPLSPGG